MPPAISDPAIVEAISHIRGNLGQPLTLDRLAARVHLSPRQFNRRFSAATGSTPGDWIFRERLDASRAILETGSDGIENIARSVGLPNTSGFRRHFRETNGVPPAKYRQTNRATAHTAATRPAVRAVDLEPDRVPNPRLDDSGRCAPRLSRPRERPCTHHQVAEFCAGSSASAKPRTTAGAAIAAPATTRPHMRPAPADAMAIRERLPEWRRLPRANSSTASRGPDRRRRHQEERRRSRRVSRLDQRRRSRRTPRGPDPVREGSEFPPADRDY
ncbi:MAG: helix-turn-helix domain-containing protein [Gaiellaceae bacterium]